MTIRTKLQKGETRNITLDWSRVAKDHTTSLSSSTWESDSSNVTINSSSTSGNNSTASLTNANTENGCTTLTNTATMADGQILVRKVIIELIDDTCAPNIPNDYRRVY